MGDFEEKLNAILSSPEAMSQIMELAGSLNGDSTSQENVQSRKEENTENPGENQGTDGLQGLLSGMDPATLSRIGTLLREYQSGTDEKTALLNAMRPFLSPEGQGKVGRAIQITRLSRVIRASMGLFRGTGDV